MKKRIVFINIYLLIVGITLALAIFPEFWQNTPVLKDIYFWIDKYLGKFMSLVTKSEERFFYISIIGGLLVTIFALLLINVAKKNPKETFKNVNVNPTISNKDGKTTIIVVEEN